MNRRIYANHAFSHAVILTGLLTVAGCITPEANDAYSHTRPTALPQYAAAPSRAQAAYPPAAPRETPPTFSESSTPPAPLPAPPIVASAPQPAMPTSRPAATTAALSAPSLAPPQNRLASRSIERPGVLHASSASFNQQVLQSDVPVLVDFYASWCGPCKTLAPTLDELAAENPGARVVKVNIEESPDLAARYGVRSVPSLMVFKDGQIVTRQQGVVSKARLTAMLGM